MDNLPLLRDIHLPPENGIFPLGYGWILLPIVLLALYICYRFWRYWRKHSRKLFALKLIKSYASDSLAAASGISEVLRRVCRYKYKNAVALYGKDWVAFLNNHCKSKISGSPANLLAFAPYMPNGKKFLHEDYQALRSFALKWIGENL